LGVRDSFSELNLDSLNLYYIGYVGEVGPYLSNSLTIVGVSLLTTVTNITLVATYPEEVWDIVGNLCYLRMWTYER